MKPKDTIKVAEGLAKFWAAPHGWAPDGAATLLSEAKLDRFASFAHTLEDFLHPFPKQSYDARIIIGYATLRSMAESLLKLFFSIYFEDYSKDPEIIRIRRGEVSDPDNSKFDQLIHLFSLKGGHDCIPLLRRIQARGNGIHSFKDREIGVQHELIEDIEAFGNLILETNARLPYPDDMYNPAFHIQSQKDRTK